MQVKVYTTVTQEMIDELAENMQEIDKESIYMFSGMTPKAGLEDSVANANESLAWEVDGQIVAICGITQVSFLSNWACAWLLCSPYAFKSRRLFLAATKDWVETKTKEYGHLKNYVYGKHERSKRWLQWLGFTLHPAQKLGPHQAEFNLAEKRV